MQDRFEGKVAVITGGASGIGFSTAMRLADEGARVVLAGRNRDRGQTAARVICDEHGEAVFVRTDVSAERDVQALVDTAIDRFGGLDYLFNNAGVEGVVAPLQDWSDRDVRDVVATNLVGVIWGLKHGGAAIEERGGGAIVNNASFVGTRVPFPDGMVYGATKAAVVSLTRSFAVAHTDRGIRAYAVCPWMTETPMLRRLTGGSDEARDAMASLNPSGRFAASDDVARVVCDMLAGHGAYHPGDAYLVDAHATTEPLAEPL